MKLGILGTGLMVHMALPTLKKAGMERMALLARPASREKAQALAEEYALDGVFYDYDDLLASDIDTVYVALPNLLHFEYAKKALLAGKHAIVEKPMVPSVRAWEELEALAGSRGLVLAEAMTVHYLPAIRELKNRLDGIGPARLVLFNYSQRSSRYDGFLRGETHPVFDPNQAGGALMDLNVYNLHALLTLFGPPQAARYQANVRRGIDTSGVLTLDYGEFQAVAVGAKDCRGPSGGVIQGEKGTIRFSGPVSGLTVFEETDNAGGTKTFRVEGDRLLWEFQTLRDMIDGGDRSALTQAHAVTAAATRILEDARSQVGVRFPGDGDLS